MLRWTRESVDLQAPHPPSPPATPLLRAERVEVVFSKGVRALAGVSFEVVQDDFVVILGRSGAGKSTLLRCLNRLVTPTAGRVLFRGRDVTRASGGPLRQLRRRVGMIFQQFNLVGRLTVLENVLAGRLGAGAGGLRWACSHAGLFGRVDRRIAIDSLEAVGIAALARRRADTLSGGQQQRVAIARVLAQQPDVILADEPIASLDPHSAEMVLGALREINRSRRIPIVLNLHQVDLARQYARRVVGMHAGRVVYNGGPAGLDLPGIEAIYNGPRVASEVTPVALGTPADRPSDPPDAAGEHAEPTEPNEVTR